MLRIRRRGSLVLFLGCSLLLNLIFICSYLRNFESFVTVKKSVYDTLHLSEYYVCPLFDGGLGNEMFQFASAYGIAKSKGLKLALNKDMELFDSFEINLQPLENEPAICEKAIERGEYHPCGYDKDMYDFQLNQNTKLTGYIQSWKYFKDVNSDLRQRLKFKDAILKNSKDIISSAIKPWVEKGLGRNSLTLIGVHIRRGDILEQEKVEYGYLTATPGYLLNAMNYYRQKYSNTIFLCFTNPNDNDTLWVKENVKGNDVIVMKPNRRELDMCIIASCNHTIMTVGSFGWWASWLNIGETIYSLNFARNGSDLEQDFGENINDYYYPGWIGLS